MVNRWALVLVLACGGPTGDAIGCAQQHCAGATVRRFSPSEELQALTARSLDRWHAATGIDLQIQEGGTPVVFADDVWGQDPADPSKMVLQCGATTLFQPAAGAAIAIRIEIDRSPPALCPNHEQTLLHEVGHCITLVANHTRRGVMSTKTRYANGLDDESVAFICSHVECTAFNPERYLAPIDH